MVVTISFIKAIFDTKIVRNRDTLKKNVEMVRE